MYKLPYYGNTSPTGTAFRPRTVQKTLQSTMLPSAQVRVNTILNASQIRLVADAINQGDMETTKGLEQFSKLEQQAIKEALATGDQSSLSPEHIAWIEAQVAQKEAEFMALAEQQKATVEEQLASDAFLRDEALKKQAADKAQVIKQQQMKQAVVYGAVLITGIALIGGLYYKGK